MIGSDHLIFLDNPFTHVEKCVWSEHRGQYFAEINAATSGKFTLTDAKSTCLKLGRGNCGGITCVGTECTIRKQSVLRYSSASHTSFEPDGTCFLRGLLIYACCLMTSW